MYSGSTLTPLSGSVLGAHQKIDRIARQQLDTLLPRNRFPGAEAILHFEGHKGPDAIKRKSPAKDEPWHFLRPFDLDDVHLLGIIESHYRRLVKSLEQNDEVRAAFEAAWLAHAVVDGLTPAHHYPYEEKLAELYSGPTLKKRTTVTKKVLLPGKGPRHRLHNNWKMWGPKGLFTTHAAFEWGVAVLIAPMRFRGTLPTQANLAYFQSLPLSQWFRQTAQEIARMDLYDAFYESGWTISLARRVRNQLTPALIQAVALVWYGAALEAREAGKAKKG